MEIYNKIQPIENIAHLAEDCRDKKCTIALSHGVFDLIHPGHIRHLWAAKRKASKLIVSVTADAFVNKGPGRPVHPEMYRAEHLATFECVDWVVINSAPTAENVIDLIKPHFYVKGAEYENEKDDITGKIVNERAAVEKYGGKLVFTNDITFSSSNLINKHMNFHDPKLRKILDRYREENACEEMVDLIDKVKDYEVTIVGDTIIDIYRFVKPLGGPSKENIIAVEYENEETYAGGIIAAANHIASFVRKVRVITVLGRDGYNEFIRESVAPNVTLEAIECDSPTTRKLRYVDINYNRKLFEVYEANKIPRDVAIEDLLGNRLKETTSNLTIVTDFGHGVITESIRYATERYSRFMAVTAQTNAGNRGFNFITKYYGIEYACLDEAEARLASANDEIPLNDLIIRLNSQINSDHMIITCGRNGCIVYDPKKVDPTIIPAFTVDPKDTLGAGDAFLAITALLVKAGGKLEHIGFIGNAVGALKVGIIGHRKPVDKVSVLKFLKGVLQ
jgi:rfaE bifunctional protein nucleotidyltransferase chain/domain